MSVPRSKHGKQKAEEKIKLTIRWCEGCTAMSTTDIDLAQKHGCDHPKGTENFILDTDGEVEPVVIGLFE
jgi:hypothetical protein